MPALPLTDPAPDQAVQVLDADHIFVSLGVNLGDAISLPDDVVLGDIYALEQGAKPRKLVVSHRAGGQVVGEGSQLGKVGARIQGLGRFSLMADDGAKVELILLQTDDGALMVLPLSPMSSHLTYQLVSVSKETALVDLADLLCVSFVRGTKITLHNGAQKAIEDLKIGDRVLTRDHGGQELRWVSKATFRAFGSFAPVVISAGTLGNSGDLIVSQHHRIFLYQRRKLAGIQSSELMVQAKHLVDGERVFLREGGFVDYFSLVFDHHEIIYAEGIPAESLMVNDATVSKLPPEISVEVKERFPGLAQVPHFGTEAGRNFLEEIGPEALFLRGRPSRTP